MGFYARRIFPWINDRLTGTGDVTALRREVLADASGDVIEIGFGSGMNLPIYPVTVTSVTAVEPNEGILDRSVERVAAFGRPVDVVAAGAERLPLADAAFDTAVSTLVLCSVADPSAVVRELNRVLKPAGKFLVLEHGRAADPRVVVWQNRLNRFENVVACGCNLNRPVVEMVTGGGFRFERIRSFYMEGAPKPMGWMTLGVAVKA